MNSTVETLYTSDGLPYYEITSPKTKQKYTVRKSNDGFCFYEVAVAKGNVPSVCEGKYTNPFNAIKTVQKFIETMRVSQTVERDAKYAERHKNASKSGSDSKDNVQ